MTATAQKVGWRAYCEQRGYSPSEVVLEVIVWWGEDSIVPSRDKARRPNRCADVDRHEHALHRYIVEACDRLDEKQAKGRR